MVATTLKDKLSEAKQAVISMRSVSPSDIDKAILSISSALVSRKEEIIAENKKDVEAAKKKKANPLVIKMLSVSEPALDFVSTGLKELASLPPSVGQTLRSISLGDGMELYCVSSPIGIIAAMLDSRPLSLVEIFALCLKSGNALAFEPGDYSSRTVLILLDIIKKAISENNIPSGIIQAIEGKPEAKKLLETDSGADLCICAGGKDSIDFCKKFSNLPTIYNTEGVCHVYVDSDADLDMAANICYDSKCQFPEAANAMETLIVHKDIAKDFLSKLKDLLDVPQVKLTGDDGALKILSIEHASDKDWDNDYSSLELSIRVVDNIDDAIIHINTHGARHTDSIVTKSREKAKKFMERVDSSSVFWNASTRFSGGIFYGMGAEACNSSSKIPVRGPVGVESLLTYKWKLVGNGNISSDYLSADKKKKISHSDLGKVFPL